jgi:hypothetical protein
MTPSPSAFVLVPGAGGDAWYWSRVVPLLRAAGRDAVAVDLPAGDEDAGLDDYADVILAAIGDRRDVALVAQSMGAFCAPLAAVRSEAVVRLDLTCPMIPAPGESAGAWWSGSGQSDARRAAERAGGRDPDAPFDERSGFFHDVAEDVVDEAYAQPQQGQSERSFAEPFPLDAWPDDIPTRVLLGRGDRLFPYTFMQELTRTRLGVEADAIDAGHLASLSQPRAVADWLLKD